MLGADAATDLEPVDLGQHDVEHGQVHPAGGQARQGLAAAGRALHRVPGAFEGDLTQPAHGGIVVDDEDERTHRLYAGPPGAGSGSRPTAAPTIPTRRPLRPRARLRGGSEMAAGGDY